MLFDDAMTLLPVVPKLVSLETDAYLKCVSLPHAIFSTFTAGSPTCTQCPVGTTSTPAGILCNDCVPGYYSDQQVRPDQMCVCDVWLTHGIGMYYYHW